MKKVGPHSKNYFLLATLIWVISAAYFFYDYTEQVIPNIIGQQLRLEFHFGSTTLSLIAGIYYLIYAIEQIPIGMVIDHFGPHKPLCFAILLASIATLLFSYSSSTAQLILFRFFIGAGAAFSFVTCLKLVSNWFPERIFASMAGLTNLVGMCGAIFGGEPLTLIVKAIGWRNTMLYLSFAGMGLFLLVVLIIRNAPPKSKRFRDLAGESRGVKKTLSDLKHMISHPYAWIDGLYAFMINVPFAGIGALWGVAFAEKAYHLQPAEAAFLSSMIFIGGIPGSFLVGWISDRLRLRKLPMIVCALGALIIMTILLYTPSLPLLAAYILMFFLGFFSSGNVVAYAYGHDIRPPGSAGISLGFINTCLIAGSALSQLFIGWLLGKVSSSNVYSLNDYRYALTSVIAALVIALVAACFLKETRAVSTH